MLIENQLSTGNIGKQYQSVCLKIRNKDQMSCHAFLAIIITILISNSFLSCSWKWISTDPKGGVIYVGQPQVLSRETIVPERQAEAEWLKEQLAQTPKTASFQGINDYLVTQAFSAKLAASFDPLKGKVRDERNKLEIDKLEAERNRFKIEQEIEETKLRNLLKKVEDEGQVADAPQLQPTAIDQSKLDSINEKIDELEKKIKVFEEASAKPGDAGSELDSLAGMRARKSTVTLTPFELLKDQMAFRSQVNAARREKLLDETHDLMGRSLYEMKFSVAMVPPKDHGLFAYVEIQMDDNQTYNLPKEIQLLEKMFNGIFYRRLAWALANRVYREHTIIMSEVEYGVPEIDFLRFVNTSPGNSKFDVDTIERYLKFKYNKLLPFLFIKKIDVKDKSFLSVKPNLKKCGEEKFKKLLVRLQEEEIDQEKVINIEPKEYAQNISKVSSRQNMIELMASLSAILQGGVEAGASVGYSKQTRELLEANQRQPLAIGFNNKDSSFGWILGPKFEIYKGKSYFSHVPINYPLNATFVVPAWADSISLKVSSGWIDKNGRKIVNSGWIDKNGKTVKIGEPIEYDVPLSPATDGLIDAFIDIFIGPNRSPRIFIPKDRFALIQGIRNQKLLIRGYHLWRNPEVYVNNLRADKVDILPNMEGIYAHFNSEIVIDSNIGDLTVVTNTGMKHIPKIVQLVPEKGQSISPFIKLSISRMLWAERSKSLDDVLLSIDQSMKPKLLPQFEAFAFKEGFAANRKNVGIISSGASELKLSIPKEVASGLKNIDIVEIDVRVRRNSGDLFGSSVVSGKKAFVVFKNESDMQLAMTTKQGTTTDPIKIAFKKDDSLKSIILKVPITKKSLFYRAYPGFSNAKDIFLYTTNPILNIPPVKSFSIDFKKGIFYFMIPVTVLGKEDSIVIDNLYVRYGTDDRIIPVRHKLKLEKQN